MSARRKMQSKLGMINDVRYTHEMAQMHKTLN